MTTLAAHVTAIRLREHMAPPADSSELPISEANNYDLAINNSGGFVPAVGRSQDHTGGLVLLMVGDCTTPYADRALGPGKAVAVVVCIEACAVLQKIGLVVLCAQQAFITIPWRDSRYTVA